jgi:hypothetical protein
MIFETVLCLSSDSPRVHYSRVKHIFRDSYYRYSLYVGVKLAVSGSEVSSVLGVGELVYKTACLRTEGTRVCH